MKTKRCSYCLVALLAATAATAAASSPDSCESKASSCDSRESGVLRLEPLDDSYKDRNKLFFIESSGRDHLPSRYLCAVESALTYSGLPVVVLMTSPVLDVNAHNATDLVLDKFGDMLAFRHVDPAVLLAESPFGENTKEVLERIQSSEKPIQHLSDALRLAVVYKYGGWYADIDTIWLRSVADIADDVISTDGYLPKLHTVAEDRDGDHVVGDGLSNGLFRFARSGSPYLRKVIKYFVLYYRPEVWTSGGASIMAPAFREQCGFSRGDQEWREGFSVERYNADRCGGLQLYHPKHFFPKAWLQATDLWDAHTLEYWEDFLSEAYSIDFFQSSVRNDRKILRPKNYGKKMPAYAALGHTRCPLAFYSERTF